MTLNSESLFHFTSSRENIESILKDGFFWPIYCAEVDKEYKDHLHACAFPMVCFCDIPLSQIEEHTNDYGNYAIAMSKEWAKKRGVSPVTYYAGSESLAIKLLRRNENIVSKKDKAFWLSLLKKYRGKTWSLKENGFKNKVLYNEREWRYIPQNIPYKELILKVDYSSFEKKDASENARKYGLKFTLEDIRYIILDKEEERIAFINNLKKVITDEYNLTIICSKILTIEQIKDDF